MRKNLFSKYLSDDVLVSFPYVELFSPELKRFQEEKEEYIEEKEEKEEE